jgi:acyl dehydratase
VVNTSFAGRVYPPLPVYEVSREKLADFARATGQPVAGAAEEQSAPPTFAITVAQRCDAQLIEDPQAEIDFTRVVHGEQSFVHHRPMRVGDRLLAVLHVDTLRPIGGHAMLTTRSEITTEEGEPVCTATSTLVIRGPES